MKYPEIFIRTLHAQCNGNITEMAKSADQTYSVMKSACRTLGLKNKRKKGRKIHVAPATEEYKRTVQLLPTMNNTMISNETGLSRERVRQIRNEHGVPSPLKHKRCSLIWNEEKLAILCKLDMEKYTRPEIADRLGISMEQLCKKCKEIGIDLTVCIHPNNLKYPKDMLLALYEKHNGNIYQIAKQFTDKRDRKSLNPIAVGFHRRFKRLGLRGKGEQFVKGKSARPEKYTKELLKPLWDKHKGNMSAMARSLNIQPSTVWQACKRHGWLNNEH